MKHLFGLSATLVTAALLIFAGCGDDGGGSGSDRDPRDFLIPSELSFEEAAAQAVAGDTLTIADLAITLEATVEFRAGQTPLLIRGTKYYPLITILGDDPPLRFVNPNPGTRIQGMLLSAPKTGLEAVGPGEITVADCRFTGCEVQVLARNAGLDLTVTDCLMRDAELYAIDVEGGSVLFAEQNTVDAAGDCSVRLQSGASGTVRNCILHRSANYGVACLGTASLADSSTCNDIHLSGSAPFMGCEAPEGNFDLDPLFCNLDGGNYTLVSISPCTPVNSGGCGQIGAFPAACEPE